MLYLPLRINLGSWILDQFLPTGKIKPELLKDIIQRAPVFDHRIVLGPGIGLDCGVIDGGDRYLVMKTDPITFATEEIGWYAVQISANDIATTGAKPEWMMITALMPEKSTTERLILEITNQIYQAAAEINISLVNAHTEITVDLNRPILVCSLIGEVEKDRLVTPKGVRPGNELLLTKGIPIEGTALLAKEFPDLLKEVLSEDELIEAKAFTHIPGIGVTKDAQIALQNGTVTGMHDPTEGGLASALWEFSTASGYALEIDPERIPIPELSAKICKRFHLNPLNTIASGALLLSVEAQDSAKIIQALEKADISCSKIGLVTDQKEVSVSDIKNKTLLPWPEQDDITKVFQHENRLF